MARMSRLEALPCEITLQIIRELGARDVVTLQSASKRLLKICRDNVLWRDRCCPDAAPLSRRSEGSSGHHDLRLQAEWDPAFRDENIAWYDEYIHRFGPTSTSWFKSKYHNGSRKLDIGEVNGVDIYRRSEGKELFAVSPLDDGAVCIWDVKGARGAKGSVISKSDPSLLHNESYRPSRPVSAGITGNVSIDSQRGCGYFAVDGLLTEVDLETLRPISAHPYASIITSLSAAVPHVPLTVGTIHGVYLHDYRARPQVRHMYSECLDGVSDNRDPMLSHIFSDPEPHTTLPQPGPLSILHLDRPGCKNSPSDDILISGRFQCILHYDRRMFSKTAEHRIIKGTIYSGAHLSSMTSLPYSFSSLEGRVGQQGNSDWEQGWKAGESGGGRTLITCGEYKGRGSLEVYDLSSEPGDQDVGGGLHARCLVKNRYTASQSKLLSIINHGTRLAYSDCQGNIKWVERDGKSTVRTHRIEGPEVRQEQSLFDSMPGAGEIARKLLSTSSDDQTSSHFNEDDILFWTGDRLGLVTFSANPICDPNDPKDNLSSEELELEREASCYGQNMRRALERHANDVRFVRYLGAGIRSDV